MKKLISVALLSIIVAGCGTDIKERQIDTSQAYEYSDVYTDSSESHTSEVDDSSEFHSAGLDFIYDTIGKPVSKFTDSVDMSEFYYKRVSNSNPMVNPFGDDGILIPFNDTDYYFGIQSDKASWQEPSSFTLDYCYVDTFDIKEELGIDINVYTDGSNRDEVKEKFVELWGNPLGTVEYRSGFGYADVYKHNDIYISALYSSDDINDYYYTGLEFSNEHYIRCVVAENHLSKLRLDPINLEPNYINTTDLESINLQYIDAVFSVDTSKIVIDSELLVDDDGTMIADLYTECHAISDTGSIYKFELSSTDEYPIKYCECSKEYDTYKYYTDDVYFDACIETDNLIIRVGLELTEEERDILVEIINKGFILQ